jgi:acetyl esterase/lipase
MDFPWLGLAGLLFGVWIYRTAKKDGRATWKAVLFAVGGTWLTFSLAIWLAIAFL